MPRRQYSDQDRDAALAFYDAARGNLNQAARLADIPRNTLRRWVSEREYLKEGGEQEDGVEDATLSTPLPTVATATPGALSPTSTGKGEVLKRWIELRDRCFKELLVAFREASFSDLVTAAKAATDMVLRLKTTYEDEDIEELLGEWVAIVQKHVTDDKALEAISQDLRRAAERRRDQSRSS